MPLPVIFICHGGGPMPLMGQQPEYMEVLCAQPCLPGHACSTNTHVCF